MGLRVVACTLLCLIPWAPVAAQTPAVLEAACGRAGDNAAALRAAWQQVPPAQRAGLEFLLEHMPDADARTLSAEFLLRQVDHAYAVRAQVPWGAALLDALFFGHVLPYAQANEAREDWRSDFVRRFVPTVLDCRTPGEAALRLNATIFAELNVHYSTGRARADQAPSASIAQGKASCTGLSILLADACRACCVPARLVSVRWPHKAGNHTWVEVWDGAAWRFVGADEPDPAGFDRAWFVGDAAKAAVADREHRPWAVSFANTGERFAAGWGRGIELWGEDVGARYAPVGWSDGHGGTIPRTLPFDLGADAAAAALGVQLDRFFAASPEARTRFEFDRNLDEELKTKGGDTRLRALVFAAWRRSERAALAGDHEQGQVRIGDATRSFTVKQVGEKPVGGWPLVIALQDTADAAGLSGDVSGHLRCTLRVPADEGQGDAAARAHPWIAALIRQFVVCADVDPDHVLAVGLELPPRFVAARASRPRELSWKAEDASRKDHHWLHVDAPEPGLIVDARLDGQRLDVVTNRDVVVQVHLDARLCDLGQELEVHRVRRADRGTDTSRSQVSDSHHERMRPAPSLRTLCATMAECGDPALAATWVLTL